MDNNDQSAGRGDERSATIIPLRRSPATDAPALLAADLQRLAVDASATLTNLVATADEYGVEVPAHVRQAAAVLEEPTAGQGAVNRRQAMGQAAVLAGALLLRQRTGAMQGLRRVAGDEAIERVTHVLQGPSRVDAATVADMESVTAAYRRSYRQLSARTLLPQAEGQAELVRELLGGSMKATLRDRLTATAGEAAALVGVMLLMDLYSFDAAWAKLTDALDLARAAKAQELEAFVLGCMAFNAGYTGRRVEAVNLVTQARKLAADGDGTTTRGWLAAVDGELRARSGNASGCLAALEAAERSLQDITNGDPGPWVGVGAFDAAKLKGYYGLCYLQLRRPHKAVTELTGALDALDPALRKHRCTALADLATALIDLGEIEEGCRRATQALTLAIDLRHAVSVQRIRDLDQRLAPWGDAAAVKAFREQLIEQLLLAFHQSTLPAAW
jgi:tetratricopeptide (TPR) repeat protein